LWLRELPGDARLRVVGDDGGSAARHAQHLLVGIHSSHEASRTHAVGGRASYDASAAGDICDTHVLADICSVQDWLDPGLEERRHQVSLVDLARAASEWSQPGGTVNRHRSL
jgi:hypothetical protein